MDMTTNAVLLPMMLCVCPSCSVSVMILSPPVWLTCLVVCFWIVASVCLAVCFIASQFVFRLIPMLVCTSVFACQRMKKYNVILLHSPSTTCPNNTCAAQFPIQLIHMIYPFPTLNNHRFPLYSLSSGRIECIPLCLTIAFTFLQSLNAFVGRSFGCSLRGMVL